MSPDELNQYAMQTADAEYANAQEFGQGVLNPGIIGIVSRVVPQSGRLNKAT